MNDETRRLINALMACIRDNGEFKGRAELLIWGSSVLSGSPHTITLPRAEVEALMEAARSAWDEACANHEKAPPIKYLAPYGGLVRLHTALTTLQERMK